MLVGNPAMYFYPIQRGVELLSVAKETGISSDLMGQTLLYLYLIEIASN